MPESTSIERPLFEVVSPLGEPVDEASASNARGAANSKKIKPAAPLLDLNGKKIGLVWSAFRNGNVFLEATELLLAERFKDIELVRVPGGRGLHWGDRPQENIADLAKELRLDGAIAAAAG